MQTAALRFPLRPEETWLSSGLAQSNIPTLDGLRALAVLLVIFGHSGLPLPGGLGVLIFFVLSGFLITWLLLNEYDRSGGISLWRFYIRRSARIFPAFYAFSAIVILLFAMRHKPILWPQARAALFFYNNYYQALLGDPNTTFSHTWSLAVEEQFYLIWPVVFFIWRHRIKNLKPLMVTVIIGVWLHRAILQWGLHVNQGYLYEAFDTRADHLLIGCLLAMVLWTSRSDARWSAITGLRHLVLTVCFLLISVLFEKAYGSGYRDSVAFLANPLLAALLIVQLIACRNLIVVRWMQTGPVKYVGKISYSLYLYQQLVLPSADKALTNYPAVIKLPLMVLAVVAVASVSFYLVEKPFLRLTRSPKVRHTHKSPFGFPETQWTRERTLLPNE